MKQKQADRLYEILRHRILSRELQPHQRLVERDLAEDFQCSRIPVREALHRLVQEGLLETKPNWGSYVRHLSKEEWEQAQEIRAMLEGYIFALVAKKQPTQAFRQLRRILDKMRAAAEAGDDTVSDELDLEFHRVLVVATGNKWLMDLYPRVAVAVIPLAIYKHVGGRLLQTDLAKHEDLLRILMSGDVEAARLAGEQHKDSEANRADADWGKPPSPRRKQGKKKTERAHVEESPDGAETGSRENGLPTCSPELIPGA